MNTSHENIYYIDPWFIAREYEARKNRPIPSRVTRSSQTNGDASIGLAKVSVGNQESLVFEHSPETAFWEISSELNDIEDIQIDPDAELPSLFWVSGTFSLTGRSHKHNSKLTDEVWVYSISQDDKFIRLLAEDSFFRFNLHSLTKHPHTLGSNFRPKVRALLKGFRTVGDDRFLLATPLVILEEN
ncbi:hypothetical protein ACFPK9_00600 [Rubritalea spongiae]|uniref:Uncharacterized protein n=1 Tax=Rubritalea spongiae TaxID=430797 RepID=A0ABW5E5Z3_9BACT